DGPDAPGAAACWPAAAARAGSRPACSAARNVTNAALRKIAAPRIISQMDRLFRIAHHPKTYCCTVAVRTITPGQSQLRNGSGLPVGTPDDVAGTVLRPQWIGYRSGVHE